ncbi:KAT8 regulatory NSL complex subunit 1 [Diabrotica undecimpunctata]|uniref:KAT8 regulatory NSL complex subunit 1 n=1 Tax=Diabrotica undecimpunctata TaxID=50387 RepID=UPI003B63C6A2
MGLRTASVRHPHVEVMAPALTETVQTQNFDLPPKSCLEPDFAVNSYRKNKFIVQDKQAYLKGGDEYLGKVHLNSNEIKSSLILESEKTLSSYYKKLNSASDNIMNSSPSSMGDQENKMGLQKTGLEISMVQKDRKIDMEQLLENLSVPPDLETNVEDIMQVIKSIEGNDRLNNSSNDINAENDDIFPIAGTDLTNNLSSFEKALLENVDVMNMSMDDQQDELDTVDKQKESQGKEIINLLQTKHTKLERRLDFLKRRVYKLQSRLLGQHVSSEVAGVFENVHHALKKPKEPHEVPVSIFGKTLSYTDKVKPLSYSSAKTLVRKLETTTTLQANTVARQKTIPTYFGSGSLEVPFSRTSVTGGITLIPWPSDTKSELQKVAAQLKTQAGVMQKEVDSEATESSSGGESCDEMQNYNNPHQQYLGIQKRALWKYSNDRALIAAKWTWLQGQIADLEHRIRQHTDLHKQARLNKGSIQLGGASPPHIPPASQTAVNGYRGQLPGGSLLSSKLADDATEESATDYQCARTRPLTKFKKRKLLQMAGLHAVSRKAVRPSTMRCGCVPLSNPCALCTGRTDPTYPRDPPDTLSRAEKIMLLDPSFHNVFSLPEDISESIHLDAIMKTQEWQQKCTRMKNFKVVSKPERHEPKTSEHRTKKLEHRKKYTRSLKTGTLSALTAAKIRNKIRGRKPGRPSLNRVHRKRHLTDISSQSSAFPTDSAADEEIESIDNNSNQGVTGDSPSSSPLLHMHSVSGNNNKRSSNRFQSYDIDNIVIPYSVAASTRVEKLQYKEILTPKWRIIDPDYGNQFETKNNGAVKENDQDTDEEDLKEETVTARHDRSEYEEKKRFASYLKFPLGSRPRSNRRTDSRAESSGANTPDPMSPHNPDHHDSPMTSPPATPLSAAGTDESQSLPHVPSAVVRRRTMSQSRFGMGGKEREMKDDSRATTPDIVEVPPYDKRTFPLNDEIYEKMLRHMPEDHQFQTNSRSQDSTENESRDYDSYLDQKAPDSPDTESTESAIGDGEEEDPNDPEWIDMERFNRDRSKR